MQMQETNYHAVIKRQQIRISWALFIMITCPCNEDPLSTHFYMSRDVRKPVFGVSDQVRHKPGWEITEDS